MSQFPELEAQSDRVPAGIFWMLVTTFFFVCVHATGKYLVVAYPVLLVVWGRYLFHLIFALLILGPRLRHLMRSENLPLQFLRSGFMFGATTFYFAGVALIPLAEANAISFTTPIIIVILSYPVLGERVGPRRWLGVACGFLGALIIIRPGSGVMDLAAAFMIACSLCNAGYHLTTRKLGNRDDPLTTLFYTAVVGTLASSVAAPFVWTGIDGQGWLLMALIGAFACIGHFTLIKAYRAAPVAAVAPFNYTTLLWAVVFGVLIFGDLPEDPWTFAGAGIIVASGLYIWYRERRAAAQ